MNLLIKIKTAAPPYLYFNNKLGSTKNFYLLFIWVDSN